MRDTAQHREVKTARASAVHCERKKPAVLADVMILLSGPVSPLAPSRAGDGRPSCCAATPLGDRWPRGQDGAGNTCPLGPSSATMNMII